jgi:hypothetical protein
VRRARHQRDGRAAAQRFGGHRVPHAPARAVADETHRIDIFEGRTGGDQDASAGQRPRGARLQHLLGRDHDVRRFRKTPLPNPTARQISRTRIDHLHTACAERLEVLDDRGMLEHVGVHRGGDEDRRASRGVERRQKIIGQAVRELGNRVGRGRRHHEQVDVRRNRYVLDIRVGAGLPLIGDHLAARDGLKGQRPDELPGGLGHDRHHVVAVLLQPTRDLDGLVGADPSAHAQCN